MNELNLAQSMLARHVIGWSFIPLSLTQTEDLPSTLEDTRAYLALAEGQQGHLLQALGVKPEYLSAFVETGGDYDSFFEAQGRYYPWYAETAFCPQVISDVANIHSGIRRLHKFVDLWTQETSERLMIPLRGIFELNVQFGALALFAQDLMGTMSRDPIAGIEQFYDAELRQARRIGPSRRRSGPISPISMMPDVSVSARDTAKIAG